MPKQKDYGQAAFRERFARQKEIIEMFSEEAILEARKRLCRKCATTCPDLFPLTTGGKDCPYFQAKGKEK